MSGRTNPSWAFHLDQVSEWAYWDKAFTPEECEYIVVEGTKLKPKPATVNYGKNDLNEKARKSSVSWISPTSENEWVYKRLTDIVLNLNDRFFRFDLFGLTEELQFTEYKSNNGHYSKHVDRQSGVVIRKLSLSVQLTDPKKYKGGDLLLHFGDEPTQIKRDQGYLTMFPSYTLHEVTPVTKGTRHSLVAWITGKNFI